MLAFSAMSRRSDRDAFTEAMRGVARIGEEPRRIASRPRPPEKVQPESAADFEIVTWGDHQQGSQRGADPQQLRRLEHGDYEPELTIDLHGMIEVEAGEAVRAGLRQAIRSGMRCLRIVHGRGLRSPDGPVLKRALPAWLAQPPQGRSILAFTTAGKHGASGGATLVLLRKRPQG